MGGCVPVTEKKAKLPTRVHKSMFKFHYAVGKGGLGKVWKVSKRGEDKIYALKEMAKIKILARHSEHLVLNERRILARIKCNFIVNMEYAFQDAHNLYLLMDFVPGGDLRYHMLKRKVFSEGETRFFVACILLGLSYLHSSGVLHRDIKPENLMFDSRGYIKITDFGIARVWVPDNARDCSGTPGYMAPEVICHKNHGVEVDYFALGVIVYECMMGHRPYSGSSQKEVRDKILLHQISLEPKDAPPGWSSDSTEFINSLLQLDPTRRLGAGGPNEIMCHPWLRTFNWEDLEEGILPAPYIPDCNCDNFDLYAVTEESTDTHDFNFESAALLESPDTQAQFRGYYYEPSLIVLLISFENMY